MVSIPELFEYPFTPQKIERKGHTLAYLDQGQGMPIVMVHGNPSWSYLYRNLVTAFSSDYRCIVPDHIGCGFSDKPQDYPYRLQDHIDNLEFLLAELGIDRCHLVVHDWGGAIGMGWAGRHPEKVEKLVVLNTAAFRSEHIPLRISVCRWPLLGSLLVRGLNGFAGAAIFMAVAQKMKAGVARGFLAPYDSWANRIAVHRFVKDIPMSADHPSWQSLVDVEHSLEMLGDKPMLIAWGGKDFCFTKHFYDEWCLRFPKAEAHYFASAGHYVLEDAGAEVASLLETFLSQGR